jgi:hypothetical protein
MREVNTSSVYRCGLKLAKVSDLHRIFLYTPELVTDAKLHSID